MKNVLFFFSSTVVGGAETNILKISRELTKTGYKVFWAVLVDDGPLFEKIDFELAGKIEVGLFYKKPIKFLKAYKCFVKTNDIAIVFNFGLRVEIISRLISKRIGIKKIISNIRSTDDWRKWHHVLLDKSTHSTVDLWVSNSIAGKLAFIKRENIPSNKVEIIYNFFEPLESQPPLKKNSSGLINIGVLANITKQKGYFDLIPLAKQLNSLNFNYRFIYAGTNKLDGAFEREIANHGLQDKFEYLGYITKKSDFFAKTDIFLLPSYLEGMPTVILEAMAHNKPVISTNIGGIPEIINNGINGYLCAPGDINAFAQALIKINELGSGFLTKNAELTLKAFSKDVIMRKWLSVINS